MSIQHTVSIQLLGNHYQIACAPEDEDSLKQSAEYLDKQLRATRNKGNIVGLDRVAIMVALNSVHELLQSKNRKQEQNFDNSMINRLNHKLDVALSQFKQLPM